MGLAAQRKWSKRRTKYQRATLTEKLRLLKIFGQRVAVSATK